MVCKVLTYQNNLKALTYRYLQIISNKRKALWQTENTHRMSKWTKHKKRLITLVRVCYGKHKWYPHYRSVPCYKTHTFYRKTFKVHFLRELRKLKSIPIFPSWSLYLCVKCVKRICVKYVCVKPFKIWVKGKHFTGREFQGLLVQGNKLLI